MAEAYKYDGLTGGTIWSPNYQNLVKSGNSPMGDDERQPYMIPILVGDKPYVNVNVTAVRFSKDAALAAVAFELKDGVGQVMLYRLFKNGNLRPERDVRKPVRTFNVNEGKKMGKIIEMFIFKQMVNDEMQYNMYVLLEKGILYYPNIEKRAEPVVKMDE